MRLPRTPLSVRYAEPREGSEAADPLRILRRGAYMFLGGLSLALLASLWNAGLAFLAAYCATGLLLLSFLGYWRETGRAIMSPGTLLVLISFTFVLAVTSGVAAFAG